ncbi:MAG: hypothetical protein AAFR17_16630 [Pseudomonadota bacterium]
MREWTLIKNLSALAALLLFGFFLLDWGFGIRGLGDLTGAPVSDGRRSAGETSEQTPAAPQPLIDGTRLVLQDHPLTEGRTHRLCDGRMSFRFLSEYLGEGRAQAIRVASPETRRLQPGGEVTSGGCKVTYLGATAAEVVFEIEWVEHD